MLVLWRKKSYIKPDCLKRKPDKSKDDVDEKGKEDNALIAVEEKDKQPDEMAATASHKALVGSEATAHIVRDV